MQSADDTQLLTEFTTRRSEEAFATLVNRHINLVYSAALRQVQNPQLAQEVTQAVFIILAKKAHTLRNETILSGWLYRTAQFAAANVLKKETRRQRREQEAHMQSMLHETDSESIWENISPLLDEAMSHLGGKDRDAVILRYFEEKSLSEVGVALGTNEDTARKRVSRSVEKLRKFFTKRGTVLPAATLIGLLSANTVSAAPAGLASTIAAGAILKGTVVGASTLTIIKGTLKIMAWTKMKMTIAIGAAVALTAGTTVVVKEIITRDDGSVKTLMEFDWQKLKEEGRLLGGEVVQLEGRTVLKLESTNADGLSVPLLKVTRPPVTAMNYSVTGELKYDVEGVGHLAMWSFFSPLKPGAQEPQYYSFTGEIDGPMKKIYGTSDWRVFSLPLDRTGKTYPESFTPRIDTAVTVNPPTRLEISILLPGRGVVYLSNLKLTQTGERQTWFVKK